MHGGHHPAMRCRSSLFRWCLGWLVLTGCAWAQTGPVHPLEVGEIAVDPPTFHAIGVSLPVLAGDEDHDASVTVSYRPVGTSAWKPALPLLRVRPETLSRPYPSAFPIAHQFAGSVLGLEPDRPYEVKLDIADPDGAATTKVTTVRTRPVPPENPATPRLVPVQSAAQLREALNRAEPGDVIELANGVYPGPLRIERSGRDGQPIVVRGQERDRTIIAARGADTALIVAGSHVIVERVTLKDSAWGMRITNTSDVVVRRTRIEGVHYGIKANGGTNRHFTICDNVLSGTGVTWPDHSSKTWNFEGITVSGTGHVICHNTISGFGDSLGLSQVTAIPNRAIDFYGNDVLWGGDDGIELDYSERNVRAWENRLGNVGMGISFQPIWGGPVYAFRNVIYNTAHAPYKLNQEPSGFHIYHNTAIRPGAAWNQYGAQVSNFSFVNNLTIGTEQPVYIQPTIRLADIDYNGWAPDGEFTLQERYRSFSKLHDDSPFERHGVLLKPPFFQKAVPIPKETTSMMPPPESLEPHPACNAVDAGMRLPNINDDSVGRGPDLGAVESGRPQPQYGAREPGDRVAASRHGG